MKNYLKVLIIGSILLFVLDFLTLANKNFIDNESANGAAIAIAVLSLAVFISSCLAAIIMKIRRTPKEPISAYRRFKFWTGITGIGLILFGLPCLIVFRVSNGKSPFGSGIGDALSNFVVGTFAYAIQVIVPTPFALAFWPLLLSCIFLLFSRRKHLILDTLAFLIVISGLYTLYHMISLIK